MALSRDTIKKQNNLNDSVDQQIDFLLPPVQSAVETYIGSTLADLVTAGTDTQPIEMVIGTVITQYIQNNNITSLKVGEVSTSYNASTIQAGIEANSWLLQAYVVPVVY
jgi:hypothetical protein